MNEQSFIREHEPLGPHTTIGLGGNARYFAECRDDNEFQSAMGFAREKSLPCAILGGGSNVLVPDHGFHGMVIRVAVTGMFREADGDDVIITAGAGEPWDPFVALTCRQHLAGLECLSGIPGSVGASPVQNVGAYGQEVSSTIVDVRAINRRTLQEVHFTNPECLFGYRESRFKRSDANAFIITHVSFRLRSEGTPTVAYPELRRRIAELHTSEDPVSLALVRDTVIALRRTKGMVVDPDDPDSRSVGSFFTNPIVDSDVLGRLKNQWPDIPSFPAETKAKLSAAWLVEHAGFPKGYSLGGAAVSNKHSLALVNKGTTTDELLQLAGAIQQAVRSRFGVNIEREPVLLD